MERSVGKEVSVNSGFFCDLGSEGDWSFIVKEMEEEEEDEEEDEDVGVVIRAWMFKNRTVGSRSRNFVLAGSGRIDENFDGPN
ncbi:hypothetical protein H2198_010407 [Neophaeococcomyces mojaviensis]|uniref:Uncharacterized protein n=1 Tax=Neophaeococcomyces mojaviensis TaxID=3383035 RepID=A0ACC2ZS34_9EURO|nr:hypothetical protein H2198_010407 [Knufia sp. JES_112]